MNRENQETKDNKDDKSTEFTFLKYKYDIFIGIVLVIVNYTYHFVNLAFIFQKIATENNLNGLEDSYFGFKRDMSDYQWRSYRHSYSFLLFFALIFIILSFILKTIVLKIRNPIQTYSGSNILRIYYCIFGVCFAIYLHGTKFIIIFSILVIFYLVCKLRMNNVLAFIFCWGYCIAIKFTSEIYRGYSLKSIFHNISEDCDLQWHLVFGFVMLRMISFKTEYTNLLANKNFYEQDFKDKNMHIYNCKEWCAKENFCQKYLTNAEINIDDFSFVNYLAYIFYPPLYFTGPIITFNSFMFQIKTQFKYLNGRSEKIYYLLRYIALFISFEIYNSLFYTNAVMTNSNNKHIRDKLDNYTLILSCFSLLIFLWFKFSVIWKGARLWAWLDGINTEENMNRCMMNNYCFQDFWRAWHRSFNQWLIRYIYIPLGGEKYMFIIIWILFSFVALWHDLSWDLLVWAWFICIFMIPELLYLNDYVSWRLLNYAVGTVFILLMMVANLIGFGVHGDLYDLIKVIINNLTVYQILQFFVFLMPNTLVSFYIRAKEQDNQIIAKF